MQTPMGRPGWQLAVWAAAGQPELSPVAQGKWCVFLGVEVGGKQELCARITRLDLQLVLSVVDNIVSINAKRQVSSYCCHHRDR